jgi:hypothetical protein
VILRRVNGYCLVRNLDKITLKTNEKEIEIPEKEFDELIDWYNFGNKTWKERTKEYNEQKQKSNDS